MPRARIDLRSVNRLRNFKIDYSNVHVLEYTDTDNRLPQSFAEFRALMAPAAFIAAEQPRPRFPADLRHPQSYSNGAFPRGLMLALVQASLYASVRSSIEQYIRDLAYEGLIATAYTVSGGGPVDLRQFLVSKWPFAGALLVGSLPVT